MADNSSQSRNKTAVVDASPVWKRSKHYRDVRELLLLHRRYEINAMRVLRRAATTALNLGEEKRPRRTRTTSAAVGETSVLHEVEKKTPLKIKKGEHLTKDRRLIDSEYLSQLMSRIDTNMDLSLAESAPKANVLRLPKLESIPQGSKAIFYTSLPSIPALPKLKEPKASPRPVKRISSRNVQKSDVSQYSLPDSFLTVRQLPSDHTMVRDMGAIDAVKLTNNSALSEGTLALHIAGSGDATPTEHRKAANEELLWLVPVLENKRSFRLNKTGTRAKKDALNKDSKGRERRETTEGNSQPKYKRNVHFSEFLHEVHLYTPLSTKH